MTSSKFAIPLGWPRHRLETNKHCFSTSLTVTDLLTSLFQIKTKRLNVLGSCQRVEQRLGVLKVRRVEALGEPAVDRREEVVGLVPPALVSPQAGQAGRCTQLPELRLLLVGNGQSLAEAGLGLGPVGLRQGQPQLSPEPMQLGLDPTHSGPSDPVQGVSQEAQANGHLVRPPVGVSE